MPSEQCPIYYRQRIQHWQCKLWPCGQPCDHQVRVSFPFILCPTFDPDVISVVNALRAESEMRQFPFAARGPGNKPAAAVGTQNTKIPNRKKNLQPMPPRPPHGQMPQSTTQGQTSQPAQEQTPQPTQERALAAQPTQGQTSQLAREQTPQSPEQQTPQTTGGQKPPANGSKRRSGRAPATTATSATTAAPRR